MYTVFNCRKCGHNLYVEETQNFGEKLGKISVTECPECGEEGYENWILSCRKNCFPEEEQHDPDPDTNDPSLFPACGDDMVDL